MAQRKELYNCPAFRVLEAKGPFDHLKHGDRIAILDGTYKDGEPRWRKVDVGSVVGFAIEMGNCPFKTYEKSKARGHELYWLNTCCSVISTMKTAQEVLFGFEVGDVVRLEGKLFKIEKTFNQNFKLTFVEEYVPEWEKEEVA